MRISRSEWKISVWVLALSICFPVIWFGWRYALGLFIGMFGGMIAVFLWEWYHGRAVVDYRQDEN